MGVVIFVLMIAIAFIGYVLHGGGGKYLFFMTMESSDLSTELLALCIYRVSFDIKGPC